MPEIHAAKDIGVQPIRGTYAGDGLLHLTEFSRLILRVPDHQIRTNLKLAGKKLEMDGRAVLIGVPEVRALHTVASLRARLVTIKGFMEIDTFLDAAKRQLQAMNVAGEISVGERRTFRVKEKRVVGFEVAT